MSQVSKLPVPAVLLIAACLAAQAAGAGGAPRERAALAASGRVAPELLSDLERDGRARVVVVFAAPDALARHARELRRSESARSAVRRAIAARRAELLAALPPGSAELLRAYEATPALALSIDAAGMLALLARPEVRAIGPDALVSAQLAQSLPLTQIDAVHALGPIGDGVQMAILDTGVDGSHAELAGAVIAEQCFCDDGAPPPSAGCCPNGSTSQSGSGAAADGHGHGTRVAGIAASRGVSLSVGAAPAVEIVAVKVLSDSGAGLLSDFVLGLDWVLMNRPDVDVVNLSAAVTNEIYGGDCDASGAGMTLATPIDALRASGVPTVAGSGNAGRDDAMYPPACVAATISVGAVWDADVGSQSIFGCTDSTTAADQVTCFSNSSGTTDLFAPGGVITTPNKGGGTASARGTSFAAPHVAGCAALLIDARPWAGVDALEAALESSPTQVSHGPYAFPRLDCEAAFAALRPGRVSGLSPAGAVALAGCLLAAALAWLRLRPGVARG
jgi:subtilisin family serine protease